jgi:hypothetical protein
MKPRWQLPLNQEMEEKKMTMTREERIAELNQVAMEWECSFREALLEVLSMLYMDVFSEDYWEQELSTKTDEELLEVYLNW